MIEMMSGDRGGGFKEAPIFSGGFGMTQGTLNNSQSDGLNCKCPRESPGVVF